MIVAGDADLDKLVETLREASFYNAGQDCTAACRIFADRAIVPLLTDKLEAMVASLVYGRPERDDVEFGPVVSARQQERVAGFVDRARASGADIMQGRVTETKGYFYPPTLVAARSRRRSCRRRSSARW